VKKANEISTISAIISKYIRGSLDEARAMGGIASRMEHKD
jgi:hypothetical protein